MGSGIFGEMRTEIWTENERIENGDRDLRKTDQRLFFRLALLERKKGEQAVDKWGAGSAS